MKAMLFGKAKRGSSQKRCGHSALIGFAIQRFIIARSIKGVMMAKSTKPGGGVRFAKLKKALGKKAGVKAPGALAAYIGRQKYGPQKFAKLAAKGKGK